MLLAQRTALLGERRTPAPGQGSRRTRWPVGGRSSTARRRPRVHRCARRRSASASHCATPRVGQAAAADVSADQVSRVGDGLTVTDDGKACARPLGWLRLRVGRRAPCRPPGRPYRGSNSERDRETQARTWPSPSMTYFTDVSSRSPIGPRACSFWVEMPISAPSPSSKPSTNRVDALTSTAAESISPTKRRAACAVLGDDRFGVPARVAR